MARAEDEAEAVAMAAEVEGGLEGTRRFEIFREEYQRRLAERHRTLERDAAASARAMDGWALVEDREAWLALVRKAADDLDDGSFLIDRLGAERHLDPAMMAMLLVLRRRLIDEHGAQTAAELMMVDLAVLSYYHTLRINGWIGDLAQWLEGEFFAKGSLTIRPQNAPENYRHHDRKLPPLWVEHIVERLSEQLLPLLDRSNRIMLRNLKALREQRQAPAPSVSIGNAGQVNVAAVQSNEVG
jgi:hypothetical protein